MSQNQPEIQYAAFLAIDWADQKHVWSCRAQTRGLSTSQISAESADSKFSSGLLNDYSVPTLEALQSI